MIKTARWSKAFHATALGMLLVIGSGCELMSVHHRDVDSFLDPSMIGRWENTPIQLPVLENLDVVEDPIEDIAGLDTVRSADLIPAPKAYQMAPGDLISVSIFELIRPGAETNTTRRIDDTGNIRLPVIGQIRAGGLTDIEFEQKITEVLHPNILRDPVITVTVLEGRQRTFSVILGNSFNTGRGTGTYQLVGNMRLIDALAMAGISPETEDGTRIREKLHLVYVIRQKTLQDLSQFSPQPAAEPARAPRPATDGQPGTGSLQDPARLIEDLAGGAPAANPNAPVNPRALNPAQKGEGRFINLNGKWVWVEGPGAQGQVPTVAADAPRPNWPSIPGTENGLPQAEKLVTQRVIAIEGEKLAQGDARYNIYIRPGDVIRIPLTKTGVVYIGGHIARPGTYSLPGENKITLSQIIMSAGGLGPEAIPERVDLRRRIGGNREVVLRLNMRAIAEGVQPDIYLKPDDTINIGTNFWASHIATLRRSFRSSYGFGFLLDKNFADIASKTGISPGNGK